MLNRNALGETPLMLAAKNNHLSVVKFLLSRGAKTEILDRERYNAFIHAYRNKSRDVVQYLLLEVEGGVDIQCVHYAIDNKDYHLLRMILENTDVDLDAYASLMILKPENEEITKIAFASMKNIFPFPKQIGQTGWFSALKVAPAIRDLVLSPLAEEYRANPKEVRARLRIELGWDKIEGFL